MIVSVKSNDGIKQLEGMLQTLADPDTVLKDTVTAIVSRVKRRVHNGGRDTEGNELRTLTTGPKIGRYSKIHARERLGMGLKVNVMNLELTGELKQSGYIIKRNNKGYIFYMYSDIKVQDLENQTLQTTIFTPSEEEVTGVLENFTTAKIENVFARAN